MPRPPFFDSLILVDVEKIDCIWILRAGVFIYLFLYIVYYIVSFFTFLTVNFIFWINQLMNLKKLVYIYIYMYLDFGKIFEKVLFYFPILNK